jgi:fermentation-respiration switch protein FrsA (DUF1100 family)
MAVGMIRQLENWVLFPRYLLPPPARPREDVPGLQSMPIESSDGVVDAWFLPALGADGHVTADDAGRRAVVIFAHGNGELIDDWPLLLEPYRWMGVSVVLPEYRGYGLSPGLPSETAIREDFVAVYDKLVARSDVDPSRIVLHGRSLGGGVVCALARVRPAAGLILESTFTSVADVARKWMIPKPLLTNQFDNESVVRGFERPILIFHGTRDRVIPYSHARRLEKVAGTARLVTYDCDHNDLPRTQKGFWTDIEAYLAETGVLRAPTARTAPTAPAPTRK